MLPKEVMKGQMLGGRKKSRLRQKMLNNILKGSNEFEPQDQSKGLNSDDDCKSFYYKIL